MNDNPENINILIVNEVKIHRFSLGSILKNWNYNVYNVSSMADALKEMRNDRFDAVICCVTRLDTHSIDILERFKKSGEYLPHIIINEDIFTDIYYKKDVIRSIGHTRISFDNISDVLSAVLKFADFLSIKHHVLQITGSQLQPQTEK